MLLLANTLLAGGLSLLLLFSSGAAVGDPSPAWYDANPVVAHALGTVQGRTGTNSREAFLESYDLGQRVFEADLILTSDGFLVARHDFEDSSYVTLEQSGSGRMDYATFMNTPINYFYTPLDIDALLDLLEEHPDTYLITDTKSMDPEEIRREFQALAQAVERTGDETLYQRIIVQIYFEEMYDLVAECCPVSNWIYTLYQTENPDFYRVGQFCREKGIGVVTVDKTLCTPEANEILHSCGCRVYYHTLYMLSSMLSMTEQGADGFYTDYITLRDFAAVLPERFAGVETGG